MLTAHVTFSEQEDGAPAWSHEKERGWNEHFLYTLPAEEVVEEQLNEAKTFHAAGIICVCRRVEALQRALQANQVTIEVRRASAPLRLCHAGQQLSSCLLTGTVIP